MKKLVCLVLAALLVCCMSVAAMATKPGESVTVSLSVTGNEANALMAGVSFSYDTSALKLTAAAGQGGTTAPPVTGGEFVLNNLSGIPTGTFGTLTFEVLADAIPGTYPITVSVSYAYDASFSDVSLSVSGGKVVVDDIYCKDGEHDWDITVDKEASCTEDGQRTLICTICTKKVVEPIKAPGHKEGTPYEEKAATCTEDGKKVTKCSTCEEVLKEEAIPALGHDDGEWTETKPATCTEPGKEERKCTRCSASLESRETDALGHKAGEWTETKAATCTEPGKKVAKCVTCEEVLKEEEIAALGHDEGEWVETKAPTCTEAGKEELKCGRCGQYVDSREVAAPGHTLVKDEAVEPTCTKTGLTEGSHCSKCDYVEKKQEEVPTIPHNENTVKTIGASCTEAGKKEYYCDMCDTLQRTEEVGVLGHEVVIDKAVAPTCTETGLKEGSHCSRCNEVLVKQEVVDALGHDEVIDAAVAPTCTEDGKTEGKHCARCEAVLVEQKVDPALGHDWNDGEVIKDVTCTEDGEEKFTCKRDDSHTEIRPIKHEGHKWGEWVETKPATEDEKGEQQRTCSVCGEIETEEIDNRQTYVMTLCSNGIRFRDLENPITDYWYMFTPVDLSVEGTQEFDLVSGNIHRVGTVAVTVADGNVTVTYKLFNKKTVNVFEEYFTILPTLTGMTELDIDGMTAYTFGQPISIEKDLGGDTKVLLFLRNRAYYVEGCDGTYYFDGNGKAYDAYVEQLKQLMD